jgi:hypothetical protein
VAIIPFPVDSAQTANESLCWSPNSKQIVIGTTMKNFTGCISVWNLNKQLTDFVSREYTSHPIGYSLSQNYPNPFNPSTVISFSLPSKSFISLKVFDLIGREVATIVSEEMSAGSYSRTLNAEGLPSGVYFYRLQAGPFTETKKLVLLR